LNFFPSLSYANLLLPEFGTREIIVFAESSHVIRHSSPSLSPISENWITSSGSQSHHSITKGTFFHSPPVVKCLSAGTKLNYFEHKLLPRLSNNFAMANQITHAKVSTFCFVLHTNRVTWAGNNLFVPTQHCFTLPANLRHNPSFLKLFNFKRCCTLDTNELFDQKFRWKLTQNRRKNTEKKNKSTKRYTNRLEMLFLCFAWNQRRSQGWRELMTNYADTNIWKSWLEFLEDWMVYQGLNGFLRIWNLTLKTLRKSC
jgi:hypothetical protein